MINAALQTKTRLPRFKRAAEPPAFRLTEDDVTIIRQVARYRFLRSTHIAALIGRSLDRTNERLCRLFHAGFIDRPRAQLDYYPTRGSQPIAYALADRGAKLVAEREGNALARLEWSRKNREAGRPFIEHQLEIVDFRVALQHAADMRGDIELIHADEIVAGLAEELRNAHDPFTMHVKVSHEGLMRDIAVVPDFVFGIRFPDKSRRCFFVEIDRGTMPITRANLGQTSFERKMRAYLAAHASRLHERQFGWKAFRVLTITTDRTRVQSMIDAARQLHTPVGPGASLFFFATRDALSLADPFSFDWQIGDGRSVRLV
jgi:DNA-binding Lrp family transcriptional regulator